MNHARDQVVVIGAGLAGLSAAVGLCDSGLRVTVLEKTAHPGGRVRRLKPVGREAVDFGQHLMLGCYREARKFARRLGTEAAMVPCNDATPFISGPGKVHPYRVGSLPAPFHALPGLLGLTHLSLADRIGLARAAAAAKVAVRLAPAALDHLNAGEWLDRNGQGRAAIDGFWGPLCSATLNLPPDEASALLLATVVDRGFFAAREDAVPMLPGTTLHDLFVGPAVEAVRSSGGRVECGFAVARLACEGGSARAVVSTRGEKVEAGAFICAVPAWDAPDLLAGIAGMDRTSRDALALGASPIVCADLWFDRPVMDHPFAALLDSPVHWLFNHPGDTALEWRSFRVTAVISHATGMIDTRREVIAAEAEREVRRFLPASAGARLQGTMVVKARKATFTGRPGQAGLRPACRTPVRNLFLAGDWTGTGLPATIEGAVASGTEAARHARDLLAGGRRT